MNTITPFQFLSALYSDPLAAGQLMVWSKVRRSGKTTTDWCFDLNQAGRQVEHYRRTRDVFFGVALQDRKIALARARRRRRRAAPSSVRGSEESVLALPALWAELGFAGDPPDQPGPGGRAAARRRALAVLEAVSPPPSILVSTGTGFQVYWPLAGPLRGGRRGGPWVLADAGERRRAKGLLGKIWWALASTAEAAGWRPAAATSSTRAGGLAGLMRVAGTFEHHGTRCWPIAVERLPGARAERRWAPEDFEHLEDPPPQESPPPWDPDPATAGARDPATDFGAVWEGCSWLRHCYRDQATLPERQWSAALSIVGRVRTGSGSPDGGSADGGTAGDGSPDGDAAGRRLAHRFSHRHPGYAAKLTDQALKRALGKPAATCGRVGRGLDAWDRHCSRCPHQGRIQSPIVLGTRRPAGTAATGRGSAVAPALAPATEAEAREPAQGPSCGLTSDPGASAAAAAAPMTEIGGLPSRRTADPVQPKVELWFRISPGESAWPAGWAPVVRAAMASLEGFFPSAAVPLPVSPGGVVDLPPGPPPGDPAPLIDGLEELLATLGSVATARQMAAALGAPRNRGRFGVLRAALRNLLPPLEGGTPTARQLGWALGSWRGRDAGGRTLVRVGRGSQGGQWAVRKTRSRTGDPSRTDRNGGKGR